MHRFIRQILSSSQLRTRVRNEHTSNSQRSQSSSQTGRSALESAEPTQVSSVIAGLVGHFHRSREGAQERSVRALAAKQTEMEEALAAKQAEMDAHVAAAEAYRTATVAAMAALEHRVKQLEDLAQLL